MCKIQKPTLTTMPNNTAKLLQTIIQQTVLTCPSCRSEILTLWNTTGTLCRLIFCPNCTWSIHLEGQPPTHHHKTGPPSNSSLDLLTFQIDALRNLLQSKNAPTTPQ